MLETFPSPPPTRTCAQLFASHGEVSSASVVMDRESGRSRGFGFVEMDTANADGGDRGAGRPRHGRPLAARERGGVQDPPLVAPVAERRCRSFS